MENHQKFYQQRRNLILSSIAISIYDIIGLEIDVINILGNQVGISNQQNIEILLIVFWVYSLIRFFQYSSIEDSFGHKKLFSQYQKYLSDFRHKYIFKKVARNVDPQSVNSDGMGARRSFKYEDIKKKSPFKWAYTYKPYDPVKDEEKNKDAVDIYFNIAEMSKPYAATFLKVLVLRPGIATKKWTVR
ncbi:hypothetical protein [Fodinibius sp. AD559]|uniref:hypothetical protein n=1 Tax=Fodinibius sp. AD559 TaxID=3424179 RepID=UPI004046B2DC